MHKKVFDLYALHEKIVEKLAKKQVDYMPIKLCYRYNRKHLGGKM